jgi:hypothetical protein
LNVSASIRPRQNANVLTAILDKAEAYAAERKIAPEVLLNWRPVSADAADSAHLRFRQGAAARLADKEV